jgi:DNA-binding CsgD family transcriptional regulator
VLYGRDAELARVDGLLAGARDGRSGVLVIRGEAGIGKTALLEHAAARYGRIAGARVLRAVGIESELELPFAVLHLLLRPATELIPTLPPPQAMAIRSAFGLTRAGEQDPFLIGVAVLTLLSELAEDGPVLCLVDDAQWVDDASSRALTFAARRLDAEPVVVLFAARDDPHDFDAAGLPELRLGGLDKTAASALLPGTPLVATVRDRILDEAAGNPLALLELPAVITAEPHYDQPGPLALRVGVGTPPGRVQAAYERRIQRLPEAVRALLLVAAAEDRGDLAVILRAARAFGAYLPDLEPAELAGLITLDAGVLSFRHPLGRAAAYRCGTAVQRLAAHRALAEVLDPGDAADRRAWHLATATTEPDESVAAELADCAERARHRAGYAAVAAAYERAAELTPDPAIRAARLAAAAHAAAEAGRLDRAEALGAAAGAAIDDPVILAGLARLRAWAEFEHGSARVAGRIYLEGAALAGDQTPAVAVPMLVDAALASWRYVRDPQPLTRAVEQLPADVPPGSPLAALVLALRGLDRLRADDVTTAVPLLRRAVTDLRRADPNVPQALIAGLICVSTADYTTLEELAQLIVARCRMDGMIGRLAVALRLLAVARFAGRARYDEGAALLDEAFRLAADTGQQRTLNHIQCGQAVVAAITGDDDRCRRLGERNIAIATAHDDTVAAAIAGWAIGLLDLGLGRYDDALARLAAINPRGHSFPVHVAADLIEAAARAGRPDRAGDALTHLREWADATGEPWVRAAALRSQALLSPEPEADRLYASATELAAESAQPFEQGRSELLYGEWLRRARRRTDARAHLHSAVELFDRAGARPWAARAGVELRATGETLGPAAPAARQLGRLTPQERQVVLRAAAGASNREIAAELFLSHRTVGYHLYKAFPKLGIASRTELVKITADWPTD